jgi:hypothetical protein
MDSPKMNWDKVRMEGKERAQGIEWTGRRRHFRPWVTESSIEQDEEAAEAEFALLPPEVKDRIENAARESADLRPQWKSPLDDD